jgi:hypothetical protein
LSARPHQNDEAADAAAEEATRIAMEREAIWRADNPEAAATLDAEVAAEIEEAADDADR